MLRTQAGAGLDRGLLLGRPPLSSLGLGLLSLGTYVLEHAWTTSRRLVDRSRVPMLALAQQSAGEHAVRLVRGMSPRNWTDVLLQCCLRIALKS